MKNQQKYSKPPLWLVSIILVLQLLVMQYVHAACPAQNINLYPDNSYQFEFVKDNGDVSTSRDIHYYMGTRKTYSFNLLQSSMEACYLTIGMRDDDTGNLIHTDYPIWLNVQRNGEANLTLNYDKINKWRADKENRNTDYLPLKIYAQLIDRPETRLSLTINVYFYLDCTNVAYTLDQIKEDQTYIVTHPALKVVYQEAQLTDQDTVDACDYSYENIEQKLYIQNEDGAKHELDLSLEVYSKFITWSKAEHQYTFQADSDEDIKFNWPEGSVFCDLGLVETKWCNITFVVHNHATALHDYTPVNGTMPQISQFKVNFISECIRLQEKTTSELNDFWTWNNHYQSTVVPQGYVIRDPKIQFYLPNVLPVLYSGENVIDRCGPITYIFSEQIPGFFDQTDAPVDASAGIYLELESSDETIVLHQPDFELTWSPVITAQLGNYNELTPFQYVSALSLDESAFHFTVTDYCLGWTPSLANITVSNNETTTSSQMYEPAMNIAKYLLQQKTVFRFAFLSYYQHKTGVQDTGCGELIYTPHFFESGIIDTKQFDYIQPNSFRFYFDAYEFGQEGTHLFKIDVKSSVLIHGPVYSKTIKLKILPCYVDYLDMRNLSLKDLLIPTEQTQELYFERFLQQPACNYDMTYTVSTIQKTSASDEDIKLQSSFEGQKVGSPTLVSLDLLNSKIYIDSYDYLLNQKTFQVIINCRVGVNESVQEEYSKELSFDVSVGPYSYYEPENKGPIIVDFIDEIKLEANNVTSVNIGQPIDLEGDSFYIANWTINVQPRPEWISFANQTNLNSLNFTFNPPESTKGENFLIELDLQDLNEEDPQKSSYEFEIIVESDPFIPNFNKTIERKEQEVPVIRDTQKIDVFIGQPTNTGLLTIEFSSEVLMLSNVTDWTESNEGSKHLQIEYLPDQYQIDQFEDQGIDMRFKWYIVGVNQTDQKRRELQEIQQSQIEEQVALIEVKRLTIQMEWSDSYLVSRNNNKDSISVKVLDQTFERDFRYQLTDEDIDSFQSKSKIEPQLSEAQQQAIEEVQKYTGSFLSAFFGSNLILGIFFLGVLQYLWGLINTLQMIVLTVLFTVDMPENAKQILIDVMKLTNLDVIKSENLLNSIFAFKAEASPINERFEASGYESSNFVIELGTIFLLIIATLILVLLREILLKLTMKCQYNWFTRRIRKKTPISVMIVRFLIESCIELSLVALIAVKKVNKEQFEHFWDTFAILLAFLMLVCLFLAPIYINYVGYRLIEKPLLLNQRQIQSYKKLFDVFKPNKHFAHRFSSMFFYRRFVMVAVIIFLPQQRNVQILAQLLSTLYILTYTANVLPYLNFVQNVQEIFNEWTVIVAAYHLFCFTEWIYDPDRRMELGWSLVCIIATNIFFNVSLLTSFVCRSFYAKGRKLYYKKKWYFYNKRQKLAQSKKKLNQFINLEDIKEEPEQEDKDLPMFIAAKTKTFQKLTQDEIDATLKRFTQPPPELKDFKTLEYTGNQIKYLYNTNMYADYFGVNKNANIAGRLLVNQDQQRPSQQLESDHQIEEEKVHKSSLVLKDFERAAENLKGKNRPYSPAYSWMTPLSPKTKKVELLTFDSYQKSDSLYVTQNMPLEATQKYTNVLQAQLKPKLLQFTNFDSKISGIRNINRFQPSSFRSPFSQTPAITPLVLPKRTEDDPADAEESKEIPVSAHTNPIMKTQSSTTLTDQTKIKYYISPYTAAANRNIYSNSTLNLTSPSPKLLQLNKRNDFL